MIRNPPHAPPRRGFPSPVARSRLPVAGCLSPSVFVFHGDLGSVSGIGEFECLCNDAHFAAAFDEIETGLDLWSHASLSKMTFTQILNSISIIEELLYLLVGLFIIDIYIGHIGQNIKLICPDKCSQQ